MLAHSTVRMHSSCMGWNDHYDFELAEMIDEAVNEGLLEETSAGYGVSQQVISQGRDSLTDKQQAFFDGAVASALKKLDRFKVRP